MGVAALQIFRSNGTLAWDSRSAPGGVLVKAKTYAAGESETLTFPDYAGATPVVVVSAFSGVKAATTGVSVDTSLGYPRVIVSSATSTRLLFVAVQ